MSSGCLHYLPCRNGEVHKHSVDLYGNWLKLAEYTPPMGGEWDNPFVLRVDQQVRLMLLVLPHCTM